MSKPTDEQMRAVESETRFRVEWWNETADGGFWLHANVYSDLEEARVQARKSTTTSKCPTRVVRLTRKAEPLYSYEVVAQAWETKL